VSGPGPPHDPAALGPEEAALGSTPKAKHANEVLRALSKAARAFTLYDAKNVIMRRFLADYRAAVEAALAAHGALALTVGPWEFLLEKDVVYAEKDRERSLAFRLFRDGVRTLVLQPGLTWEEALQLLEIVSLRFAGARQQEDDVVTLLRKAAFQHLAFTAVEGFVPSEEHPEPGAPDEVEASQAGHRALIAPDFDLPLAPVAPAPFQYREVPERYLAALRNEESPPGVRFAAAHLAAELLAAANGPASELSNAELVSFLAELRDAFLAEGAADAVLELVRCIQAQHGIGSDVLEPVVLALRTPEHLARLVEGVTGAGAPPALVELLALVGGAPVAPLAARLRETEDPGLLRALEALLVALARRAPELVLPHLGLLPQRTAARLTEVMMAGKPEQALGIATRLAESPEPSAHLEAIGLLEHAPRSEPQLTLLLRFLASPDDAVFARAATALGVLHEAKAFDLLVKEAEGRADRGQLSRESATAVGEALVQCSSRRALPLLRSWAHPRAGFLKRLVHSSQELWLQCVAVSGLGSIAGPEAEAELREVSAHATDEVLKRQCTATLMRRHRVATPGGPGRG
jgi:hypothetical protein